MATVENAKKLQVGNKRGIYPTRSLSGDQLIVSGGVLIMDGLGVGVYNSGATDIVLNIVLFENDSTNAIEVTVPSKSDWRGGFFNGVVVSGSTGHDSATTHYLYS